MNYLSGNTAHLPLHAACVVPFNVTTCHLQDLPDAAKMEALTASWRPWRSIGSWYMWRLTETEGKRTPKKAAKKLA